MAGIGAAAVLGSISDVRAAAFHHEVPPEIPAAPEQILAEPNVSTGLDPYYDQYLAWKEQLENQYDIEYSAAAFLIAAMGLTERRLGRRRFRLVAKHYLEAVRRHRHRLRRICVLVQQNQFWTGTNTPAFQTRAATADAAERLGSRTRPITRS